MIIRDREGVIRLYFSDKFIQVNLFLSLLINMALWLVLIGRRSSFSDLIPLHYNIYFGIDLLGYWYEIFLLPIFGLLVLLANFILGLPLFSRERILAYFLIGASSLAQLIFLLAGLAITSIIL
ncbi:MAG: hypothetical protein A3J62_03535 [Candidatus Buchananbacteria bacterium RIFCSPHIGHO2_02_FULL_38_8]|uniref:DUF1648 domain-containing protein n=1 Tax=Candidatus Buchananbacteria bacterium RIFCSPHIGHO2_02_FULL_38_8 TaxID=1797538 RepID=A0A1G1Y5Z0_9BACT|nr:MAG: hypothetical protein A3J62_03535 [Candidatus Buchananbacteria bacterium RIFCSPHIGHO2_02_FULL_38_8]